jgi:N-acyl-D-aspartate/D-glutamate deacylase
VSQYDLVILNGTVVVPEVGGIRMDVGAKNGVICAMADALRAADGEELRTSRDVPEVSDHLLTMA